ncbi:MAG: SDR family NAD(P)-dependent oxidoreductase, partial [Microthrixaceae bacterium]
MIEQKSNDRVVIVTGAGGGIGRFHALEFARQGAAVVVNDMGVASDGTGASESMAEQVAAEIRETGG